MLNGEALSKSISFSGSASDRVTGSDAGTLGFEARLTGGGLGDILPGLIGIVGACALLRSGLELCGWICGGAGPVLRGRSNGGLSNLLKV